MSQTSCSLFTLLVFLSLNFGMTIALPQAAHAQRFIPRVKGIPGRSSSGGTRGVGVCAQAESPLVPITSGEAVGLTTQDYPTFTWYMPEMPATEIWFVLQEGDRRIYSTQLQVTGEEKLITIKLPDSSNLPPLQVGKTYTWKFAVQCPVSEAEGDFSIPVGDFVTMQGSIRRVELSPKLSQSLQNASLSQRAAIFAKEGIWYDAVGSWLEARRQSGNDRKLKAGWQEFMNSVAWNLKAKQLENVIQAPVAASSQLVTKGE